MTRVLIAEDDRIDRRLLERTLTKAGYEVVCADDGEQALAAARSEHFTALLSDWMMPRMDGIELIGRVRAELEAPPVIIVITALDSEAARRHAQDSGADDYLAKPINPDELLERLETLISRSKQPSPRPRQAAKATARARTQPRCVCVAITASTGGPTAVRELFRQLPASEHAAFLVVLPGPDWMLETFRETLQRNTEMKVLLGEEGMRVEPGRIHLAPGGRHMLVDPSSEYLRLKDGPPVNYVKPAADPLFESVARAYGRYGIAVVLTGLGYDGTLGAEQIAASEGTVIAQDPMTAMAASMPESVITMGLASQVLGLEHIGGALDRRIKILAAQLPASIWR